MKISELKTKLPLNGVMALSLDLPEMTITVLEPENGLWLTLKETTDIERIFSEKVFLGQGHTSEEWEEWTEELKTSHKELQELLLIERNINQE